MAHGAEAATGERVMLAWLRRQLLTRGDRESQARVTVLTSETRHNIARLQTARQVLGEELRQHHRHDPVARALLRARDREEAEA